MKNFTFRQYRRNPKEEDSREPAGDPKDKDNAAYLKRREQVRRAQRTHRERKEAYIKSLENEVLQLRTNEGKILQENKSLMNEMRRMRSILEQHGISYGSPSLQGYGLTTHSSDTSAPPSASSLSITSNPNHQQQIHIFGSQGGSSNEFYLSESDGSPAGEGRKVRRKFSFFRGRGDSESISNPDSTASGQAQPSADVSAISASASNLNLRDVDQTNLGMEFVLTLEQPCLHHIQGDGDEAAQSPTGHALTVSAPLLFQSPEQPVPTTNPTSSPTWSVPNQGFEKLLSLSSNIPLTDEITPVQAWHQMRSHPDFESMEVPNLRRLTTDMLKHVKCYGFGAVIATEVFQDLVGKLLPGCGYGMAY